MLVAGARHGNLAVFPSSFLYTEEVIERLEAGLGMLGKTSTYDPRRAVGLRSSIACSGSDSSLARPDADSHHCDKTGLNWQPSSSCWQQSTPSQAPRQSPQASFDPHLPDGDCR